LLLEAQPINLGEHLQFRLVDSSKSWTQSGGVYSSTDQVKIGLQGASFQSLLAVDSGIEIDTNATRQSFTIKATPTAHNALFYYPKHPLTLASKLWESQQDSLSTADDLPTLVCLPPPDPPAPPGLRDSPDPPAKTCKPVTVAGAAVLPVADEVGLKIAN